MALQGTLETFTVPDVLRLLATTRKTGLFALEGDRGTGKVWLDEGCIGGVTSDREHGGDIDSVLFDLLRFKTGAFRFVPDEAPPESSAIGDDQDGAVDHALDRAEQLLVEWREIESVVPSLDAWVRLLPDLHEESVTIEANLWSVLAVLGGGSTGRRVGADLDLGELDACRRLRDLVELGVAEVDTEFVSAEERMGLSTFSPAPMDPPPPPPPPMADPGHQYEGFGPDRPEQTGFDEPVLVDHDLSNDEVATLGMDLASFVARPAEPEVEGEISEFDHEEDHDDEPIDLASRLNGSAHDSFELESDDAVSFGHDEVEAHGEEHDDLDQDHEDGHADEHADADEFLSQLANLSPKAAAAIEATNGADADDLGAPVMDEPQHAVGDADENSTDEGDEEINKNLLLKFLSSAKN